MMFLLISLSYIFFVTRFLQQGAALDQSLCECVNCTNYFFMLSMGTVVRRTWIRKKLGIVSLSLLPRPSNTAKICQIIQEFIVQKFHGSKSFPVS